MKLFETKVLSIGKLPEKAGLAKLLFKEDARVPFLDGGENIIIPISPELQFFPLRDGEQFLLTFGYHHEVYFGGTDESPFLTRFSGKEPLKAFTQGGEEAFYDSLVPETIKVREVEFGTKRKRQGDIFAVPVRITLEEYQRCSSLLGMVGPKECKNMEIGGTRHLFTGTALRLLDKNLWGSLVKGVIEAPDHTPLDVSEAFHELDRAQYIGD